MTYSRQRRVRGNAVEEKGLDPGMSRAKARNGETRGLSGLKSYRKISVARRAKGEGRLIGDLQVFRGGKESSQQTGCGSLAESKALPGILARGKCTTGPWRQVGGLGLSLGLYDLLAAKPLVRHYPFWEPQNTPL